MQPLCNNCTKKRLLSLVALKKIVLTQRIDIVKDYNETRESIDINLLKWLLINSFLPITISNSLLDDPFLESGKELVNNDKLDHYLSTVKPDGIVISGGNNIGEYKNRDRIEFSLLDWAKKNEKPVLGICRGMQVMAKWSGIELVELNNHVNVRHKIYCFTNDDLFPEKVNSYHDFSIESCPKDFIITAKAKDDTIEAIKHKTLPWEGWMWHPEREDEFTSIDTQRMMNLFNA